MQRTGTIDKTILFNPIQCSQEYIKKLEENPENIEEGALYFVLDTEQILLGKNTKLINMGKSTGIVYGKKDIPSDNGNPLVVFSYETDLEVLKALQIDDLILNKDGCFYRVVSVSDISVEAKKITTSGGGGAGDGNLGAGKYAIQYKPITPFNFFVEYSEFLKPKIEFEFEETYNDVSTKGTGDLYLSYKKGTDEWVEIKKPYLIYVGKNEIDISEFLDPGIVTEFNILVRGHESGLQWAVKTNYRVSAVRLYMSGPSEESIESFLWVRDLPFNYQCQGITPDGEVLEKKVSYTITSSTGEQVKSDADDSYTKKSEGTINIPLTELNTGVYSLKLKFETINGISSNEIEYMVFFKKPTETLDIPLIGLKLNKNNFNYGELLEFKARVIFEQTENITLNFEIKDNDGNLKYSSNESVKSGELIERSIISYPYQESFILKAYYLDENDDIISENNLNVNINLNSVGNYPMSQVMDKLIYQYKPIGYTNNNLNKNQYSYKFIDESGKEKTIKTQFNDFNWKINGYVGSNCLRVSGNAKHIIELPLFQTAYTQTNEIGEKETVQIDNPNATMITNGRTFEIDFKINHSLNGNAEIIRYKNSLAGFVITPSYAYLFNQELPEPELFQYDHLDKKIQTDFILRENLSAVTYLPQDSSKRIRLSFVIEPFGKNQFKKDDSGIENVQCINIYINGEFVCSKPYTKDFGISQTVNSFIEIGHPDVILDIYEISCYSKGLSENDIKTNYFNSFNTVEEKINLFENNNILKDSIDIEDKNDFNIDYKDIDYNKAIKKFPCLLVTGQLIDIPDLKEKAALTLTKPDPTNKNGYRIEFKYSNVSENKIQGTSSKTYPLRNYKFYLKENLDGNSTPTKMEYPLKGYDENGNPRSIPEHVLCWKADFMSTDHANTYNAILADNIIKSLTQETNSLKQNTIYGFRCLLFQRDSEDSTDIKFYGDGALNNDKSNAKSFGLVSGEDSGNFSIKQKWEFKNNSDDLVFFKTDRFFDTYQGGQTFVNKALESTYPDQGDLEDEGLLPNYDYLQTVFTWVSRVANFYDAETPEERETKKDIFINQFDKHFDKKRALIYYLFMEYTGLVDNRAKNMFFRCENVEEEKLKDLNGNPISIKDAYISIEENGKIINNVVDINKIDWEKSDFAKWYTDLYDLDSCYGVENIGRLNLPYFGDWYFEYPGEGKVFAGWDSRFWRMFEEAFEEDIKKTAKELSDNNVLSGLTLLNQVKENRNFVNQSLINRDMTRKFHDVWLKGFTSYGDQGAETRRTDGFKYLQRGTREFQKEAFIKKRNNLIASKYGTSQFTDYSTAIEMRTAQIVSGCYLNLVPTQFIYPIIRQGDGGEPWIGSLTPPGEICQIPLEELNSGNDLTLIYQPSLLEEIGDLSDINPHSLDLKNANLKKLIINSDENKEPALNSLKGHEQLKFLQEFVAINLKIPSLDFSNLYMLKNLNLKGSLVQTLTLPNGSIIENLKLGSKLIDLTLRNLYNLKDFTLDGYNNLNILYIENTVSPTGGKKWLEIANDRIENLNGLRLVGIDETYEDAFVFNNLIKEEYINGKYLNEDGNLTAFQNYPYIQGIVHITGEISGEEEDAIRKYYPNLTLDTSKATKVHYLTFNIPEFDDNGKFLGKYNQNVDGFQRQKILNGENGKDPADIVKPIRQENKEFFYSFVGWSLTAPNYNANDENEAENLVDGEIFLNITKNKNLYPVFSVTRKNYTIRFYQKNKTNNSLISVEPIVSISLPYGTILSNNQNQPHEEIYLPHPQQPNYQDVYVEAGWEKEPQIVTDQEDFYSLYVVEPAQYKITWITSLNSDGSYLEESKFTQIYGADEIPSYPTSKPTPTKISSDEFNFTFSGQWEDLSTGDIFEENNIPFVQKNMTYKPVFSKTTRIYTISWNIGPKTIRETQVAYGNIPTVPEDLTQGKTTALTVGTDEQDNPIIIDCTITKTLSCNKVTGPATYKIPVTAKYTHTYLSAEQTGRTTYLSKPLKFAENIIDEMVITGLQYDFQARWPNSSIRKPSVFYNLYIGAKEFGNSSYEYYRYDWSEDTQGQTLGSLVGSDQKKDSITEFYKKGTGSTIIKASDYLNTSDGKAALKYQGKATADNKQGVFIKTGGWYDVNFIYNAITFTFEL